MHTLVRKDTIFALCVGYFTIRVLGIFLFQISFDGDAAIFGSFWEAGRNATSDPYRLYPLVWTPADSGIPEINLNPPALLPLFQLFALFDPQRGQSVWLFACAILHLVLVYAIYRRADPTRAQVAWLMLSPMIYAGLGLGQIYTLMFAAGFCVWYSLRAGRVAEAAVLIGVLVAAKPIFAVWGLLALAAGHIRPAIIGGMVAAALSAVPAIIYGIDIYGEWLRAAAMDRHNAFPHDVSIIGLFSRLGVPFGWLAACVVLTGSIIWSAMVRPSLYDLTPIAALIGIICAPLAWIDYLFVIAAFIVARPWGPLMYAATGLSLASLVSARAINADYLVVALASICCFASVAFMLADFVRLRRRAPVPAK